MRIALVLGSGGAKGYAHIGVIEELKSRGHEIAVISGSSMGAVVGGLEAAGTLDEFRDWACSLSHLEVLRYMDIGLGRGGVLKAERFISKLDELCDGVHIEDLPLAFTAVATDITARREVWFQRGPLASAIRASIAVPGFIAPVLLGDHLLVDGGVLNPVPVEPTLGVPTDVTISVSLHGRDSLFDMQLLADAGNLENLDDEGESSPLSKRIGEKIAGFFSPTSQATSQASPQVSLQDGPESPQEEGHSLIVADGRASIVDVMEMSLSTMEAKMEKIRQAVFPAHVHIDIPADVCSTWDFYRAAEVIEVGRERAIEAFDRVGL